MTLYYSNSFSKILAHTTHVFRDIISTISCNGKRVIKIFEAGAGELEYTRNSLNSY